MQTTTSDRDLDSPPIPGARAKSVQLRLVCGTRLFCRRWHNERTTRGLIAVVPGFSDHSARYPHLVAAAVKQGYDVAALDTRGHGRSSGPRGHVDRFADYFVDVGRFLEHVRSEPDTGPLYLWGHSMGGLIVLGYLSAGFGPGQGVRAAVVTAPALEVTVPVPLWKELLARALLRIAPRVGLASTIDPATLSRTLDVGHRYLEDPLVHGVCTPSLYFAMKKIASSLSRSPVDYEIPTLFAHGLGDRIISPEGTRSYFRDSPLREKALHLYPEARHELHNDPAYTDLFEDSFEFFESHS
jgi:alpha-beta hydrolase superfamily lysophospholipase